MAWIDEMRSGNLSFTCSVIQRKAIELARCEGDTEFTAIRGWHAKFFNSLYAGILQSVRDCHGILCQRYIDDQLNVTRV